MTVHLYGDQNELAVAAAECFVECAETAIHERGRFTVALSGGSTPQATYRLLASDSYARRVTWQRVHVFWGDERCVPPDDSDSNYGVATSELLSHVPIPSSNTHRIRGEIDPRVAASEYEQEIRGFFGIAEQRLLHDSLFDLVFLGMGNDGHTASLFPGSDVVRNAFEGELTRWVVATYVEHLEMWRVTLTTIPINASRNVVFLVGGSGKANTLRLALAPQSARDPLPVDLIRPTDGRLVWFVDVAAAAELESFPTRAHGSIVH